MEIIPLFHLYLVLDVFISIHEWLIMNSMKTCHPSSFRHLLHLSRDTICHINNSFFRFPLFPYVDSSYLTEPQIEDVIITSYREDEDGVLRAVVNDERAQVLPDDLRDLMQEFWHALFLVLIHQ